MHVVLVTKLSIELIEDFIYRRDAETQNRIFLRFCGKNNIEKIEKAHM